MQQGTVFVNNRTQAVRLPVEARFPDNVKKVFVRVEGHRRIISPIENLWDDWFDMLDENTTDEMKRDQPNNQIREDFNA